MTGLQARDGQLFFNPSLIGSLTRISTALQLFGHWVMVDVTAESLTLEFDPRWRRRAARIPVEIRGRVEEFEPGVRRTIHLREPAHVG